MHWVLQGALIACSYGLGSLMGGLILGKMKGVDIRQSGSGNAGATNALRTQGKWFALSVFVFDFAKGFVAAGILPQLASGHAVWLPYACGAGAIAGHVWPVFFRFRGGKGWATSIGTIGAVAPLALLPVLITWVLVLVVSGYVSVGTLLGAVAFPAFLVARDGWRVTPVLDFAIFVVALILYTHRSNWIRLLRGEENRFEKARLFRRGH